jgi:disulfide bond formation protein DsbB
MSVISSENFTYANLRQLITTGPLTPIAFCAAILPLLASYFVELVLALPPCRLCLMQRYGYIALLVLACAGYICEYLYKKNINVQYNIFYLQFFNKFFKILYLIPLLYSGGFALAQIGLSLGWLEIDLCNSGLNKSSSQSLESTLNHLQTYMAIPCGKDTLSTFLAVANLIYASASGWVISRIIWNSVWPMKK